MQIQKDHNTDTAWRNGMKGVNLGYVWIDGMEWDGME